MSSSTPPTRSVDNQPTKVVRTATPLPPCFPPGQSYQANSKGAQAGCSSAQNATVNDPSTWNCPAPPKLPPSQKAVNAASILKALGVGQCVDSTFAAGGLDLEALGGGFLESSKSVGCEQVSVITDSYNSTFTAVNCALTKITNSVNMDEFAVESVQISASGHGHLFCGSGGLNLNQQQVLKMFYTGTFTGNVENSTTTNIQNYIQAIQSSMLKADVGWGATPQGQRAISQVQAQIQNYINTTDLTTITSSVMQSFYQGQQILVTISDYAVVDAGDCDFTQEGTYDLVVQNLFTTATTNITSQTALNSFIANQSQSLTSTAAGFSLGGFGSIIFFILLGVLLLMGAPLFFAKSLSKLAWPLLAIVTIAFLCSGWYLWDHNDHDWAILCFVFGGLSFVLTIFALNKYLKQRAKEKQKAAEQKQLIELQQFAAGGPAAAAAVAAAEQPAPKKGFFSFFGKKSSAAAVTPAPASGALPALPPALPPQSAKPKAASAAAVAAKGAVAPPIYPVRRNLLCRCLPFLPFLPFLRRESAVRGSCLCECECYAVVSNHIKSLPVATQKSGNVNVCDGVQFDRNHSRLHGVSRLCSVCFHEQPSGNQLAVCHSEQFRRVVGLQSTECDCTNGTVHGQRRRRLSVLPPDDSAGCSERDNPCASSSLLPNILCVRREYLSSGFDRAAICNFRCRPESGRVQLVIAGDRRTNRWHVAPVSELGLCAVLSLPHYGKVYAKF